MCYFYALDSVRSGGVERPLVKNSFFSFWNPSKRFAILLSVPDLKKKDFSRHIQTQVDQKRNRKLFLSSFWKCNLYFSHTINHKYLTYNLSIRFFNYALRMETSDIVFSISVLPRHSKFSSILSQVKIS